MFDFDDVEAQERDAGEVLEPEGDEVPLPSFPNFQPAAHRGGCGAGGRLKLLCLHGGGTNKGVMAMQMSILCCDKRIKPLVEFVCIDGGTYLPDCSDRAAVRAQFGIPDHIEGDPQKWYMKSPHHAPCETWLEIDSAISLVLSQLKKIGPVDGLCGFSEGGELVCQIARLAQEGHKDLQGAFKFVLCISAHWPKTCTQSDYRPKCPIRVPALFISERIGDEYTPGDYEDCALHWDPSFREVIWHDTGHKLPFLKGYELEHFLVFLEAFHEDDAAGEGSLVTWKPSGEFDRELVGDTTPFAFPLPRCTCAVLSPPSSSRPLQIVCFPDLEGPASEKGFVEGLHACLKDAGLVSVVSLERQRFRDFKGQQFACLRASQHPCFQQSDIVPDDVKGTAGRIANTALESGIFDGRHVVFLGIGIGAFLALECARKLTKRLEPGVPWRLYAIRPPAVHPMPSVGALGVCSVTCLLPVEDKAGERWRFAAATRGPFRVEVVLSEQGSKVDMADGDRGQELNMRPGEGGNAELEKLTAVLASRRTWEAAVVDDLRAALAPGAGVA